MHQRLLFLALLAWPACGTSAARAPRAVAPAPVTVEDLIRVRCATDGRDTFTTWRGHIWAYPADEPPRQLFDVVGMNVARCGRRGTGWYLTSRELMLYLDPVTREVLTEWTNPWTEQRVAVVHVANNPVQAVIAEPPERAEYGGAATFVIDVPLYYPTPSDPEARSPTPRMYQAGEFFTLTAPAAEVRDTRRAAVSWLALTWHRVGPWLPWMAMGDRPGFLVYSATGGRVGGLKALPALLRAEIAARLPGYRAAPRCYLDAANQTSWSYFLAHREAYRRGARFPVAEPATDPPCAR